MAAANRQLRALHARIVDNSARQRGVAARLREVALEVHMREALHLQGLHFQQQLAFQQQQMQAQQIQMQMQLAQSQGFPLGMAMMLGGGGGEGGGGGMCWPVPAPSAVAPFPVVDGNHHPLPVASPAAPPQNFYLPQGIMSPVSPMALGSPALYAGGGSGGGGGAVGVHGQDPFARQYAAHVRDGSQAQPRSEETPRRQQDQAGANGSVTPEGGQPEPAAHKDGESTPAVTPTATPSPLLPPASPSETTAAAAAAAADTPDTPPLDADEIAEQADTVSKMRTGSLGTIALPRSRAERMSLPYVETSWPE
jgi:hypothetical protein